MAVEFQDILDAADDAGKDVMKVLKPYLPALSREGPDLWEGFIKHMLDNDWTEIDKLMYEKMTPEERRALEKEVYEETYQAAKARFRRKELIKEILVKLAIRIAIKAATGGIV